MKPNRRIDVLPSSAPPHLLQDQPREGDRPEEVSPPKPRRLSEHAVSEVEMESIEVPWVPVEPFGEMVEIRTRPSSRSWLPVSPCSMTHRCWSGVGRPTSTTSAPLSLIASTNIFESASSNHPGWPRSASHHPCIVPTIGGRGRTPARSLPTVPPYRARHRTGTPQRRVRRTPGTMAIRYLQSRHAPGRCAQQDEPRRPPPTRRPGGRRTDP